MNAPMFQIGDKVEVIRATLLTGLIGQIGTIVDCYEGWNGRLTYRVEFPSLSSPQSFWGTDLQLVDYTDNLQERIYREYVEQQVEQYVARRDYTNWRKAQAIVQRIPVYWHGRAQASKPQLTYQSRLGRVTIPEND